MHIQVRQIEILKIVFCTFGGWTRIWFLMCKRLYCRLPSILPRRQCQGRFFSYLNDKRWPDALVSFRYSCWSLLLLLSSLSLSLSLSRRLLNLLDMRRTTKRWHSVGWSVGPALMVQAEKNIPYEIFVAGKIFTVRIITKRNHIDVVPPWRSSSHWHVPVNGDVS